MKRMLALTLLTLTLTLNGLALSQTPSKAEQEVNKVLDEWTDISLRSDTAAMERLLSDDFVITYINGYTNSKAEFIGTFKSGARKILSLKGERKIRVYGDTALAGGDMTDVSKMGGRDSQLYYRWSSMLVKRQDRWQVVSYHCTSIGSPRKQIEEEITKATDEMVAALGRNDVATIDRVFADNYAVIQGNGVQATKASLLEGFKSGNLKYSSTSYRDLKIKTYGDTAVTTAILTINGQNTAGDFVINAPITCTWVKQSGYWRLAAAHLSPNITPK